MYRNGQVVGFVSALDRLSVRQVSSRYLSQDERVEIADPRHAGHSIRQIAIRIGPAPSTVSWELRRDCVRGRRYEPHRAHRDAIVKRARDHKRRVETNEQLHDTISDLLAQRWSPCQISRYLRSTYPSDADMRLCHESIYQAVYQPGSVLLLAPKVESPLPSPLHTGREHRRDQQRRTRRRPRFYQPMRSVHERPFQPEDRSQAGHWESQWCCQAAIGSVRGGSAVNVRLSRIRAHSTSTRRRANAMTA